MLVDISLLDYTTNLKHPYKELKIQTQDGAILHIVVDVMEAQSLINVIGIISEPGYK